MIRAAIVAISIWFACSLLPSLGAAEIKVQGAKASELGKNSEDPQIDKGLEDYSKVLKELGYGKYEALNSDSKQGALGDKVKLNIGEYEIEFEIQEITTNYVKGRYVVHCKGKKIGAEIYSIRNGHIKPVTLGKVANPIILLISASP